MNKNTISYNKVLKKIDEMLAESANCEDVAIKRYYAYRARGIVDGLVEIGVLTESESDCLYRYISDNESLGYF